jgi:anti-sigma B factor antagonist
MIPKSLFGPFTEFLPGARYYEVLAKIASDKIGSFFQLASRRQKETPMQLTMSIKPTQDDILVLNCAGRIVFGEESAGLRDTVRKLLTSNKRMVLNLAQVTYIDSGGLGTLVALYITARNSDASIKLANLTPRVGDLLQVTKLLTVFEVFDSEEKALESFRKAA